MAITDLLNRRMQARPDDDDEVYSEDSGSEVSDNGSDEDDSENPDNAPSESDMESDVEEEEEEENDDEEASEADSEPPKEEDDFQSSLNNISFGALAKAQASLGPKSKRTAKTAKPTTADGENQGAASASPLDDIRARIREAREQKRTASSKGKGGGPEKKPLSRSSKHAPAVQSSKRAVSRKRTVVEPPAVQKSRDPRFDPTVLSQGGVKHNPEAARKAYAFLDEYRSAELNELKEKFRKTKNPAEKEALQRSIRSATDRERAIQNRRREREVVAEHKKREKQLIREGKKSNPYFLKNSELKKQVLLKKYDNMNSKERTKALERRRKKVASKERKQMPMERRGFDDGGAEEPRKRRRVA